MSDDNGKDVVGSNKPGDGHFVTPDEVKEKRVLVCRIWMTKDKNVMIDSPLIKDAPAFLLKLMTQAMGGVIDIIGAKETKKIITPSTGFMGKLKQSTLGAFGKRREI